MEEDSRKFAKTFFKDVFLNKGAVYSYSVILVVLALVPIVFAAIRYKDVKDNRLYLMQRNEYLELRNALTSEETDAIAEEFSENCLYELFGKDWVSQEVVKEWGYEMRINGKIFSGNALEVPAGELKVEITETDKGTKFPISMHEQGRINFKDVGRELPDYVSVSGGTYNKTEEDNKQTLLYEFNIKEDEVIEFSFGATLASRMGVKSNVKIVGIS